MCCNQFLHLEPQVEGDTGLITVLYMHVHLPYHRQPLCSVGPQGLAVTKDRRGEQLLLLLFCDEGHCGPSVYLHLDDLTIYRDIYCDGVTVSDT